MNGPTTQSNFYRFNFETHILKSSVCACVYVYETGRSYYVIVY